MLVEGEDRPMFEQAFKNVDDVLRKEAGCTTELDYTEQTSWLLFLKYLDGLEQDRATEAELQGKKYAFILDKAYRWESWAAPKGKDGKLDHNAAKTGDDLRDFVSGKLFPYLQGFKHRFLLNLACLLKSFTIAQGDLAPVRGKSFGSPS
jgi:type I restriction enzyme M protein